MTDKEREEAIAILKAIIPKDSRGNGKVLNTLAITKAILTAIEALEQQPSEDCVSRKEVINTIFYKSDNNCDVVLSLDLMDRIKRLPSVTPQPKTEQQPRELLILKSRLLLRKSDIKEWEENIKRGKEEGLIILPSYFEPILVPNDVEIKIEQELNIESEGKQ